MKQRWIIVLITLLMLLLTGCGKETEKAEDETTTVMIYMVGSDLEAKSGAATNDLQEIMDSGIDLTKNNVIVYAGGSPIWHNEAANAEQHTILQLTDKGFGTVAAKETSSMGDAACLTELLYYGYQYYPADQYALIFWNHGNGPVIGYGKDMLFDNDSLTLKEMQTALEASPFGEDNQLAWVGFDACLMASAELSCVWADYARYLVASQEVEPSFGWDYSFLVDLGKVDTQTLMQSLTDGYLKTCEAYYEERGYEKRDTTLSCVDLSYADALQTAIDMLFEKAAADVGSSYNDLAVKRVQTRSLGRASTGSEYDLIDLGDMAEQLRVDYPEEAEQLKRILEQMVIANASNAEACCGLSLYYPFYNKEYYEASWGETYAELGLFSQYQQYLEVYQKVWLQSDLLEEMTDCGTPEQTTSNTYTLQLTERQAETFAEASYYILKREGQDLYTKIYSSSDVSNTEGLLTANFDGNVLYVKNDYGLSVIPVTQEFDTVNGLTRYAVYARLTNAISGMIAWPDGYEYQVEGYRFDLAVDQTSKEIAMSALVPYDLELDADTLMSGKATDADLTGWTTCVFLNARHRYLTRYENGTIRPVDEWATSEVYSGYEMPIGDGLDFGYLPLASGEYHLVFEIEDTQGNRYCSELLPIQVENEEVTEGIEPLNVQWETGNEIQLLQQNGVSVSLVKADRWGDPIYAFQVTNDNAFPVVLKTDGLTVNRSIDCSTGYSGYFAVAAGETKTDPDGMNFGTAEDLGVIGSVEALAFSIKMENALTRSTVVPQQFFEVEMSSGTAIDMDAFAEKTISGPFLGALAEEQVIYQDDELRITLLCCGEDTLFENLTGYLQFTNLTDQPIEIKPEGIVLNDVYIPLSSQSLTLSARCSVYQQISVLNDRLQRGMITSIESMQLQLRRTAQKALVGGFADMIWCPVVLSQTGGGDKSFREGDQILMDENGIRIALQQSMEANGAIYWYVTVVNDGNEDIQLTMSDVTINGEAVPDGEYAGQYLDESCVGARQKCVSIISYRSNTTELTELAFRFRVLDLAGEEVIFEGSEMITLQVEN